MRIDEVLGAGAAASIRATEAHARLVNSLMPSKAYLREMDLAARSLRDLDPLYPHGLKGLTEAARRSEETVAAVATAISAFGLPNEASTRMAEMLRAHGAYVAAGGLSIDDRLADAVRAMNVAASAPFEAIGRATAAFSVGENAFSDMGRALGAQWSAITDHLAEQGRILSAVSRHLIDLPGLGTDARRLHARQTKLARVLADAGWPLPLDCGGADLEKAVRIARRKDARALDRWMVRLYFRDDGASLRGLRERLQKRFSRRWLKRWAADVEDIFDGLLEDKRWNRAALALPILDRLATKAAGINNSRLKLGMWSKVPRPGGLLLVDVLYVSMGRFLEHAWAYAPFGGKRPDQQNRHWILHGYATVRRKSDALRLVVALDLASEIAAHVRAQERRQRRRASVTPKKGTK
jgi:hypothetical protein